MGSKKTNKQSGGATHLVHPPRIVLGFVQDYIGLSRTYRVACEQDVLNCTDVRGGTGFGPFAATDISAYPPGSSVIVAVFGQMNYILGAVPGISESVRTGVPDQVVGSTRTDVFNLLPHYYVPQLTPPGTYASYSSRRPYDALPGSSQGWLNELGLGYGVDRFFTWLRASELAGIWCFYEDGLTRLAAHNFDFWTAGGERTIRSDGGEVSDISLTTPYAWEAMGLRASGLLALKEDDTGGTYRTGQWKSWLGPKDADQTIRPRDVRLDGYAGDLSRQQVCYPLTGGHEVETLGSDPPYAGLSDIHRGIDGSVSIRSAKRVLLEKYALLPVPRVRHLPEDRRGDDPEVDYRAAGLHGEGAERPAYVRKQWDWRAENLPAFCWIPSLWDYHAYADNYESFQALLGHEKDFWVPNEGKVPGSLTDGDAVYVGKSNIGARTAYPPPDFAELRVDHRFDKGCRYYRSRSFVELMDDGSVVIEDGYGAGMVLSGGNILLTCPGDVLFRPGRSLISWAPRDTVLRSGGSVDLTSAKKDVRIKAERNVHVLAGNSGQTGGLLLESRAAAPAFDFTKAGEKAVSSGIVLLAKTSPLLSYAQGTYVRSLGRDLVLDASGARRVDVSDQHSRWAARQFDDTVGDTPRPDGTADEAAVSNFFTSSSMLFGSPNFFHIAASNIFMSGEGTLYSKHGVLLYKGTAIYQGSVLAGGSLWCGGQCVSAGPNSASSHANPDGAVRRILQAPDPPQTEEPFEKPEEILVDAQGRAREQTSSSLLIMHTVHFSANAVGADAFYPRLGFSCRTEEDYGLDGRDYIVAESRWQQAYRANQLGAKWEEPSVRAPTGELTAPHPGSALWDGGEAYRTADTQLWDWQAGRNADRGDAYAKAQASVLAPKSLKEGYIVSVGT